MIDLQLVMILLHDEGVKFQLSKNTLNTNKTTVSSALHHTRKLETLIDDTGGNLTTEGHYDESRFAVLHGSPQKYYARCPNIFIIAPSLNKKLIKDQPKMFPPLNFAE